MNKLLIDNYLAEKRKADKDLFKVPPKELLYEYTRMVFGILIRHMVLNEIFEKSKNPSNQLKEFQKNHEDYVSLLTTGFLKYFYKESLSTSDLLLMFEEKEQFLSNTEDHYRADEEAFLKDLKKLSTMKKYKSCIISDYFKNLDVTHNFIMAYLPDTH